MPAAALADTYTYTYQDTSGDAFVYTTAAPLTFYIPRTVNFASCSYHGASCNEYGYGFAPLGSHDYIEYVTAQNSEVEVAAFAPGSFALGAPNQAGFFTNSLRTATLSVVDDTAAAVTPEPSSFVLLATGIVGLAGLVRCRVSRA